MDWAPTEVELPSFPAGTYLAWASWWHRLDLYFRDLSREEASTGVQVLDRSTVWDEFLKVLSREASKAILTRRPTIEPVLRASRRELQEAAQLGHARIDWLAHLGQEAFLAGAPRPDQQVMRITHKLLGAIEEAAGIAARASSG